MPSSILGALLFDRKPKVPQYPLVDIPKEQLGAISENIKALPTLEDLATRIDKFSADELEAQLERALPGYKSLVAQGTANVKAMAAGKVPEDVQQRLQQYYAEQGIATGTSGAGFNLGNLMGAFGRTSYDIMTQGQSALQSWLNESQRRAPVWDFTSMFVTPQQRINVKLQENQMLFQRNWLANKIKAMPEGWESAVKGLLDWVSNTGASVVSMGIGGAMGGGGIGGMMGGGGGGGSAPYSSMFSGMNTNYGMSPYDVGPAGSPANAGYSIGPGGTYSYGSPVTSTDIGPGTGAGPDDFSNWWKTQGGF